MDELLYDAIKSAFLGSLEHHDRKWPVDMRAQKKMKCLFTIYVFSILILLKSYFKSIKLLSANIKHLYFVALFYRYNLFDNTRSTKDVRYLSFSKEISD